MIALKYLGGPDTFPEVSVVVGKPGGGECRSTDTRDSYFMGFGNDVLNVSRSPVFIV